MPASFNIKSQRWRTKCIIYKRPRLIATYKWATQHCAQQLVTASEIMTAEDAIMTAEGPILRASAPVWRFSMIEVAMGTEAVEGAFKKIAVDFAVEIAVEGAFKEIAVEALLIEGALDETMMTMMMSTLTSTTATVMTTSTTVRRMSLTQNALMSRSWTRPLQRKKRKEPKEPKSTSLQRKRKEPKSTSLQRTSRVLQW
jgi:hypothetical protein